MNVLESIAAALALAAFVFGGWFLTDVLLRSDHTPLESSSWYLRPLALYLRARLGIRERTDEPESSGGSDA